MQKRTAPRGCSWFVVSRLLLDSFFSSRFLCGNFFGGCLGSSDLLGGWLLCYWLGFAGRFGSFCELTLFASGLVLVHYAFLGGGVDGALGLALSWLGVSLAGDSTVESLNGVL